MNRTSPLAYLKRFSLTELKIDRSFVQDLPGEAHAGAIVDAILALARTLDLDVVAEGIETCEQRDFLMARLPPAARLPARQTASHRRVRSWLWGGHALSRQRFLRR
ncbi:EAL domain-containing protein [Herbaspirillum sp. SJZ107]|uniref:EAL domain-containing protein n=1 Tax=Herbaspirillum sp. SJZ107 TaxID=2572881 RepID=UPI003519F332